MKRPFVLQRITNEDPGELELEVEWNNRISLENSDFLAPINVWFKVAQTGGMGGDTIPPWKSSLVYLTPELIDEYTILFRFNEVLIDPRSLMILENVLHYLHITGSSLKKARISSSLLPSYLISEDEFPPLYEPVPFAYSYSAVDLRVWLEIEFEEDQTEEVLDEVSSIAQMWGNLGAVCGYAEPDAMPTAGYLVLDKNERYADMLTLSIQRKRVTEFAFDGLVNMLQVFYLRGIRFREIRVL